MPLNQPSSAAAEISIVAVWLSQRVKWRYWVSRIIELVEGFLVISAAIGRNDRRRTILRRRFHFRTLMTIVGCLEADVLQKEVGGSIMEKNDRHHVLSQVLELAGSDARDTRKTALCRGTFSLQLNDEELSKLPGNVTIANGGVLPNIHQHLLPTKSGKGKIDISSASQHSWLEALVVGCGDGGWESDVRSRYWIGTASGVY
ncbi:hypothetical protein QQ045_002827 [Rhodiola kirilowii]